MEAQIVGELGVERGREELTLPGGNHAPVWQPQHLLGSSPNPGNDRSADKGEPVRLLSRLQKGNRDIHFERIDLPPKGIALDFHVHQTNQRLVAPDFFGEQDGARAGASNRAGLPEGAQRLYQIKSDEQLANGGGFSARDDQTLQPFEVPGQPHLSDISPEFLEADAVFAKIALKGKNAYLHRLSSITNRGLPFFRRPAGRWRSVQPLLHPDCG